MSTGLEAGQVGLVLTYAVTLVGNFQWTVRQSAEVENMVSPVRFLTYFLSESSALCFDQRIIPRFSALIKHQTAGKRRALDQRKVDF